MIPAATETGHRPTRSFIGNSDEVRPAGKYCVNNKGEPILAAKKLHIPEVMKLDNPPLPIKDKSTTYNTVHAKAGFPYHYSPERPKPVELKHVEVHERMPGGKRHPFEVKSNQLLQKKSHFLTNLLCGL